MHVCHKVENLISKAIPAHIKHYKMKLNFCIIYWVKLILSHSLLQWKCVCVTVNQRSLPDLQWQAHKYEDMKINSVSMLSEILEGGRCTLPSATA